MAGHQAAKLKLQQTLILLLDNETLLAKFAGKPL